MDFCKGRIPPDTLQIALEAHIHGILRSLIIVPGDSLIGVGLVLVVLVLVLVVLGVVFLIIDVVACHYVHYYVNHP